jgi:hypothetical protein
MPPHVPKPGAGDTGPRGVRIADGEYGPPITSQCKPVDKIRIGKRHRLDLGDIAGLAESIEDLGTPLPDHGRPRMDVCRPERGGSLLTSNSGGRRSRQTS